MIGSRLLRVSRALLLLVAGGAAPLAAQVRDNVPGVELGIVYQTVARPALAVKPFTGVAGESGRIESIVSRDLRFSNRFTVMDSLPASMVGGAGIDYALFDNLGAVWLLTGAVEEAGGGGFSLALELHDVVYRQRKEMGRFPVPAPSHADFRMAVHRAADEVVRWATGERGVAATRIAFSMFRDGATELWAVDSDGENLRRLTNHGQIILSPSWFRDGSRIAYSLQDMATGETKIRELNLRSGREWTLETGRRGQHLTPSYSPDGTQLAFSLLGDTRGIYVWDLERDCCLRAVQSGRWDDLTPSWAPDGRRLVFNSNRLGVSTPQIYVTPVGGGEADLVSPYRFGQSGHYTSPDWSPTGDRVAFHGRIGQGRYHILVSDIGGRANRVAQLTFEGNNEDPSWAPDGRHIAFVGERSFGFGLYVVDTVTGATRPVLLGIRAKVPKWSPRLGPS
jgi:TolB protein